ncbi:MAG: penicillin-binding protein 2 [Candidatus Paceibacterota bacterium]|nr:penicillin-binding protein 2 [Candidatus Paceibacterota bacterium]MDD4831049.1 penicillin-binding protein 2 [Candidatus Paceibacterota bacterium]MDD4875439.1 penicillin-binding protein 2 [Candidatus Paceibacterota bacterium]
MLNCQFPKNLKDFKLKKPKTEIETDEIFWDNVAQKREKFSGDASCKMETPIAVHNIWLLFFFFLLVMAVLFSREAYLQTAKSQELLQQSRKNRFLAQELKAQRGVIYDRNNKQLVFNESSFDLICDVEKFEKENLQKEASLRRLAELLSRDWLDMQKEIDDRFAEKKENEFILAESLNINQVIIFNAQAEELTGFEIGESKKRNYADSRIFAPIIGYVSSEGETGAGLEIYYNDYLKEKPGLMQFERTAIGEILDSRLETPPKTGENLILNIDAGLQEKIYKTLSETLESYGLEKASAVAVNPQNGELLAVVSIPSFDNNVFSENISHEEYEEIINDPDFSLFNRAVSGSYPVGSTVKPLLASAALEEKIIGADQIINCEGGIALKDGTFKSDWKSHGPTDMRKAIAESCDVFFYMIGGGYGSQKGLGIDRIKKYFDLYGFGAATKIDLPEEDFGFVPDREWKEAKTGQVWYPGDTYNISIGQGYLKVTPLQLTMAIAAIANGGKLYSPRLVSKIVDDENNIIKEIKPELIRENFISSESLRVVREGMRQTVSVYGGTATSLNFLPVEAAAKTGTVETSKKEYYHILITSFAPYEEPTIALTIILENVYQHLSIANAPAREILNWYFTPEELRPENAPAVQENEGGSSSDSILEGRREEAVDENAGH